jgi:hypothetical protein
MSSTATQTPLYSSTYMITSSISQLPTASSTYIWSPTQTPSASSTQSPSVSYTLTQLPSASLSPSLTRAPSPSFTLSPSLSQSCRLSSKPTPDPTVLGSISDNTFYSVIVAIIFIFLLNLSYSIHYYNAYTNEKLRRRLINDTVQHNPYHTNVRDTFNRV